MEKLINVGAHLSRLVDSTKDWDIAMLFMADRPPLVIQDNVTIKYASAKKDILVITYRARHPRPTSDAEMDKIFNVSTFVAVEKIWSIDYLVEERVLDVRNKIIT